jgi:hypothetical protein
VGSRAPIRGPLPLLGPAARCWVCWLSETHVSGRVFRRETSELTLLPAQWNAHNSTEVLEVATKLLNLLYLSLLRTEISHVRTLQPITNPNFQEYIYGMQQFLYWSHWCDTSYYVGSLSTASVQRTTHTPHSVWAIAKHPLAANCHALAALGNPL